ncbi:MAG: GHKL domain-containing protein [Lachnospiraceae bacterium]|nr:GHKL domain-containing protein [Lachnospiraceae bacterium]
MEGRFWYILIGAVLVTAALAVLVTVKVVTRLQEKRIGEYQDKILKTQRDEVQAIYHTMRGWRHDYHNHMQTIKAYLSMGQVAETLTYLEHLEGDLDAIDIAIRTGNVSVDAIVSSKLSVAAKKKISVDCTAKMPEQVKVTDVDLCTILGNLLDNAIEACEKVPEEKRFLRLYIGVFKKQLYLSVTNATAEKRRKKLYELVSAKKGSHGFGLRRIDLVAGKYSGFVNRKNEPGVFVTEVMLPI